MHRFIHSAEKRTTPPPAPFTYTFPAILYSHPPKASYGVAPLRRTTTYCLQRRALSETFGGWLYVASQSRCNGYKKDAHKRYCRNFKTLQESTNERLDPSCANRTGIYIMVQRARGRSITAIVAAPGRSKFTSCARSNATATAILAAQARHGTLPPQAQAR